MVPSDSPGLQIVFSGAIERSLGGRQVPLKSGAAQSIPFPLVASRTAVINLRSKTSHLLCIRARNSNSPGDQLDADPIFNPMQYVSMNVSHMHRLISLLASELLKSCRRKETLSGSSFAFDTQAFVRV